MSKRQDVLQILVLVLIGMFVPFLVSISLTYGLELEKIGVAFLTFILIFGAELGAVYVYFSLGGSRTNRKIEKYRPK